MRVTRVPADETELVAHGRISPAFEVHRVFDVGPSPVGAARLHLTERTLEASYWKDYDAEPGNRPIDWARRFDLSGWMIFAAWNEAGGRVGGAVAVHGSPEVDLLEGRDDLACLWDLRVDQSFRGAGYGTALFHAVEEWAHARGCAELTVETQTINVPACRFYARRGCELRRADPRAYPNLPHETQLLWIKRLSP